MNNTVLIVLGVIVAVALLRPKAEATVRAPAVNAPPVGASQNDSPAETFQEVAYGMEKIMKGAADLIGSFTQRN